METTVRDFFNRDNRADGSATDDFRDIIEMAKGYARCSSMCVYLIDYATRGFLWFSDSLSIFSGVSNEELREMGYDIFISHVPEDEQRMLVEINRAGWELYQQIPIEERLDYTIFYSFHFTVGRRKVLVDHRLTAVKLDSDGNCRIALCVFSPSSLKDAGHVIFRHQDSREFLEYSFEGRRWKKGKIEPLTNIERDVLLMSFQGFKQTEIADKIHYSVETVKHIKAKLFERFGVSNITQAVSYAANHRLFYSSRNTLKTRSPNR